VYRTLDLIAPAKLNLTLRVVGRRADGYHLLDSLTAFCGFGDRVTVQLCNTGDSVVVFGPFAESISSENIVSRVVDLYRAATGLPATVKITIEKNIPVAAGLGGGSCDAGAVLRALQGLAPEPLPAAALDRVALALGADVPVCLRGQSARMRGIGERLDRVGSLPPVGLVLVNPGVGIPSSGIFHNFNGPYSAPRCPPSGIWPAETLFRYIGARARNDLTAPATALVPEIMDILAALQSQPGVRCSGMSGSGATCFALFNADDDDAACNAAANARSHGWWAVATHLLD
jgi:4-diphosphocytidyl-2-C-methyl-D-erythritol kinase